MKPFRTVQALLGVALAVFDSELIELRESGVPLIELKTAISNKYILENLFKMFGVESNKQNYKDIIYSLDSARAEAGMPNSLAILDKNEVSDPAFLTIETEIKLAVIKGRNTQRNTEHK